MSTDDLVEIDEKYPEHRKLDDVKDQSQEIGFFLEWLSHKYSLCTWHEGYTETLEDSGPDKEDLNIYVPEGYYPEHVDINHLLAEYFDINYEELQREKDEMLKEIRSKL